ncbi:MAG TPA: hypothetical protein VGE11_20400 [Pseudonocardia sp.]
MRSSGAGRAVGVQADVSNAADLHVMVKTAVDTVLLRPGARDTPVTHGSTFQTFIGLVVGLIAQTRCRTVCAAACDHQSPLVSAKCSIL